MRSDPTLNVLSSVTRHEVGMRVSMNAHEPSLRMRRTAPQSRKMQGMRSWRGDDSGVNGTMPALYLDCDGFFASCEESADPALHGRPVAVATTDPDNPDSVLIAVNPAAKHRGVGKGERVRDARAAVPEITIRHQRPELYVAIHHAIARAVDTVLPSAQSRSIDELAADLEVNDNPQAILDAVKAAIAEAVGPIITVSCAVAPSDYLAKTAAEANKTDARDAETGGSCGNLRRTHPIHWRRQRGRRSQ